MARKTIEQLIQDAYDHPDVQSAILQSVQDNKTEADILSGKLSLPSQYDAERFAAGVDVHEQAFRHQKSQVIGGQPYNRGEHMKAEDRLAQLREGQ